MNNDKRIRTTFALLTAALVVVSCGGGGGGGVANPGTSASAGVGVIEGIVDVPALGNEAVRNALALSNAAITLILPSGEIRHKTANGDGQFKFDNVPQGQFLETTAEKDGLKYAMFVDLSGLNVSKNITCRTTVAAMVYKELKRRGKMLPKSISSIEDSTIIRELESAIEAQTVEGAFQYDDVLTGEAVKGIADRIEAGADLSDNAAPTLAMAYPAEGAQISDVAFLSAGSYVEWSYQDGGPADSDSLEVSLEVEGYGELDIGPFFEETNEKGLLFTIRSGSTLVDALREYLPLTENSKTRTAGIKVSISDLTGNRATLIRKFKIYPFGPSLPPD